MLLLIFLDIFWSIAALWVDISKLATIPVWAWIFVTVCPIYPILLAIIWYKHLKNKTPNPYLLAFAIIPSMVFGVLALVYYSSQIHFNGFNWNDFGEIFWVLFYSIQGWYLFFRFKLNSWPILFVLGYLIVKFLIDYFYQTFGYLATETLPHSILVVLCTAAIGLSLAISFLGTLKN